MSNKDKDNKVDDKNYGTKLYKNLDTGHLHQVKASSPKPKGNWICVG